MAVKAELAEKVQQWVDFLYNDFPSIGLFYCITQGLYGELAQAYPLPSEDSPTQTGVVLNPNHAGQCLTEVQRTTAFVRGLDQAVADQIAAGEAPVKVFYAGCGPFATLILPLTYRYTPQQLQVSLLDYHQQSVDTARDLLNSLGKGEYVEDWAVHDAVTYRMPKGYTPHIFVTETLQRALTQECQVPIVQNILPQLPDQVVMVPQEIRVGGLWTTLPEGPENRATIRPDDVELDDIIRFNAQTARTGDFVRSIPGKAKAASGQTFCLRTEIDVYGQWKLRRNESGLTCPHPMPEAVVVPGQQMYFTYEVGRHPGLRPA